MTLPATISALQAAGWPARTVSQTCTPPNNDLGGATPLTLVQYTFLKLQGTLGTFPNPLSGAPVVSGAPCMADFGEVGLPFSEGAVSFLQTKGFVLSLVGTDTFGIKHFTVALASAPPTCQTFSDADVNFSVYIQVESEVPDANQITAKTLHDFLDQPGLGGPTWIIIESDGREIFQTQNLDLAAMAYNSVPTPGYTFEYDPDPKLDTLS